MSKCKALIGSAWNLVCKAHANQRRDGAGGPGSGEPYTTHLDNVFRILIDHGVRDDVTLCAALLHDAIEDTYLNYGDLVEIFGEGVAKIVAELSDDTRKPRKERLEEDSERYCKMCIQAVHVKLADMMDNLRSFDWCPSRQENFAKKMAHSISLFECHQLTGLSIEDRLPKFWPALRSLHNAARMECTAVLNRGAEDDNDNNSKTKADKKT